MILTDVHITNTETAANAVMSEVFAMQCCVCAADQLGMPESACIDPTSDTALFLNRIYYRYL